MDLYDVIEKRCSIREYRDQPIEEDKLLRVLEAGRAAPTARNRQELKLIVVRDPGIRAKLVEAAEQPWIRSAPIIIAVVGLTDGQTMYCKVPTDPVDCAIVIDHMTLAAVAEGLGTCWVGHFDQEACSKILAVPDGARIIELLPIGYPAVEPSAEKPRKSFDELVCFDQYT
jgi:nitroreductase